MPTARALIATCLVVLLAALTPPVWAKVDRDGPTELEQHDRARLLTVITQQEPIEPRDYAPDDLVAWPGTDFRVRAEVRDQLAQLFAAAQRDGHDLRVISGFRSYSTQAGTYAYWQQQYGTATADRVSARPGHSEHQTGLAVDLDSVSGQCYLRQCFGDTPEGRWVAQHAHEFGFIRSYPAAAQAVTGFVYEPWHLRYVGPRVAADMRARGTLLLRTYLGAPASSARIGELLGSRD